MSVRLEHPEHEIEKEHEHERPDVLCEAPGREGEEEEKEPILCMGRPGEGEGEEEEEEGRDALATPPAGLAERWRQRSAEPPGVEFEQVWSELTAFLRTCATSNEATRPPSARVDELWHEFILFTREYHAFCSRLGGYIHHVPDV